MPIGVFLCYPDRYALFIILLCLLPGLHKTVAEELMYDLESSGLLSPRHYDMPRDVTPSPAVMHGVERDLPHCSVTAGSRAQHRERRTW